MANLETLIASVRAEIKETLDRLRGTWDYTNPDQPRWISFYDLAPPNDLCFSIEQLVFGNQDYEWIFKPPNINPDNEPIYESYTRKGRKHWRLRPDWRDYLAKPDKWAMRHIWSDVENRFGSTIPGMYGSVQSWKKVWDPLLLERMVLKYPPIIKLVHEISRKGVNNHTLRPLMSTMTSFFRMDFKKAQQEAWGEENPELWKYALELLDKSNLLICQFCVRHYHLNPDEWVPMLASHADLSEYYKYFSPTSSLKSKGFNLAFKKSEEQ